MAEFMFVNLNDPTQNKRREVRKLVRSHVSHIQHSQRRIELGQIQKQSKARYTDRSVNGWAVLDDISRAGQSSQPKVDAASGVHSGLLAQHQAALPGSGPSRSPRQLYNEELPAVGKSRRRPRRTQCQPKPSPTPNTPTFDAHADTNGNPNKDPPRAASIPPTVKSEATVTSPDMVGVKQEYEADHKSDIVPQRSSQTWNTSSSYMIGLGWAGYQRLSSSSTPLYSSLGDPTDELRNRIELSGLSLSSVKAFFDRITDLMGPDCDKAHSLPTGSLRKHLMDGIATDPAARAAILICAVGAIRSYRQASLQCAHMFGLRGYVINCIQAAMDNPDTRHSDTAALAIASLGIFEVILGHESDSQTHLQGVACIKNARGGTLHWVLDGVLSWMSTLGRPQITRGSFAVLDRSNAAI